MPEQGCYGRQPSKRLVRFPDELKQRCMRLLQLRYDRYQHQDEIRPITAAVLGRALRHWPDVARETLRRRVRELVDEMRREGAPIASGGGGYSIAQTVEDFAATEAFLRRHGIATLATNARLKQTSAKDRAVGQLRLPAYHALVTGRSALALYMPTPPARTAPQPEPDQDADHQVAAPTTAQQPTQEWADSLFALA